MTEQVQIDLIYIMVYKLKYTREINETISTCTTYMYLEKGNMIRNNSFKAWRQFTLTDLSTTAGTL